MELDSKTLGMLVGIVIPAIVAVMQIFKARGSKNIVDTLVDSVEAISNSINADEMKLIKTTIKDMATRNGVGDKLYRIVKTRTSPSNKSVGVK